MFTGDPCTGAGRKRGSLVTCHASRDTTDPAWGFTRDGIQGLLKIKDTNRPCGGPMFLDIGLL